MDGGGSGLFAKAFYGEGLCPVGPLLDWLLLADDEPTYFIYPDDNT